MLEHRKIALKARLLLEFELEFQTQLESSSVKIISDASFNTAVKRTSPSTRLTRAKFPLILRAEAGLALKALSTTTVSEAGAGD